MTRIGLLAGMRVLVTGAGSGIGAAAVRLFLDEGARVLAGDVEAASLDRLGDETDALVQVCDVTDGESVRGFVDRAVDEWGGLDGAFNNAGIAVPLGQLETASEDSWRRALEVNLTGIWSCMRHELPVLRRNGGAIVNTASVAGIVGAPSSASYSAAKHGVVGLTRSAALEYGREGVRVNAIAPGLTRTALTDGLARDGVDLGAIAARTALGRIAEPAEIAEGAAWLLSYRARFVTGTVLAIDGGETAG